MTKQKSLSQTSHQKSQQKKKRKSSKTNKSAPYEVGDIVLCETFAGPNISQRVLKKVDREYTLSGQTDRVVGFEGCFTKRSDLHALKKHSVPYSGKEKLKDCISFTYDFQIIKVLKSKKGK